MNEVSPTSKITGPNCAKETKEIMPEDSCQYFWECPHCGEGLKAKQGDCCVFCSYGNNPCPPVQNNGGCC
ncbi:GDCCVxC domain-containing (seleno)protein [Fodinibius sediminis]|uniref:GDCCVxC domain-containing (seleno)protein n=1 Tax=Fodinibius sediminis TaxID=1214077 RepID=UPI00115B2FCD|nr:GDCCVxC domain-containing (seleno)protein [Fodinibius sediminis]